MEPFEPKTDFEYPIQKPSFDSVVRQKRREAELKAEQERYKVANQRVPEEPEDEPIYTEMEQKMMDLSEVGYREILDCIVDASLGRLSPYF